MALPLATARFSALAKDLKGSQAGKIIGYAIGGTVIVVAGALTWPFIKNAWRDIKETMDETQEVNKYKSTLRDLKKEGIMPNYTDATYKSMANAIFDAINGRGTDEEAIYKTFQKVANDADFSKLMLAFGRRVWDEPLFMGESTGLAGSSSGGSLIAAINSDMDNDEVQRVNDILQKNGLSLRV